LRRAYSTGLSPGEQPLPQRPVFLSLDEDKTLGVSLHRLQDDLLCLLWIVSMDSPDGVADAIQHGSGGGSKAIPSSQRIIFNSVQICVDLGIQRFGWSRSPNPALTLGHDPIRFCAPCMGAVGVIGKHIRYDRSLTYGEDVDFTLKHILRNRIVYIDNRFYFHFGKAWGNRGGLQGIRTNEIESSDRLRLQQRWGRYVRLGEKTAAAKAGKHAGRSTSASIRVKRK
jgi:hypothetical protein